ADTRREPRVWPASRNRECAVGSRFGGGLRLGTNAEPLGLYSEPSGPLLGSLAKQVWRASGAKRPSGRTIAKYIKRQLRGTDWCGRFGTFGRCRSVHRFRVPFRIGGVVSSAAGDGRAAGDRHGCNPV